MYKLLLATNDPAVVEAFRAVKWEELGFKQPRVVSTAEEALSSLRVNSGLNIPEQLDPSKLEKFFFGLILIVMMIFRPGGILPTKKKPVTIQSAAAHGKEAGR